MLVLGDRYLGRSVAHFPCSILLNRHGGLSDIYLLWQKLKWQTIAILKCEKRIQLDMEKSLPFEQ